MCVHQPEFQLTYRRPVLSLTVPDKALSSVGVSLYNTPLKRNPIVALVC